MRKLHLGCGQNQLPGWSNHDTDVDLCKKLPFEDDSVDFIFTEHVVEHLSGRDAMRFFMECQRILKRGGVVRTALPDLRRFYALATEIHIKMQYGFGAAAPNREAATRLIIFDYDHQSCWTEDLLDTMLRLAHLATQTCQVGHSSHPELSGLEGRGVMAGGSGINEAQTCVVEGTKP